jgi:hypothetical protein
LYGNLFGKSYLLGSGLEHTKQSVNIIMNAAQLLNPKAFAKGNKPGAKKTPNYGTLLLVAFGVFVGKGRYWVKVLACERLPSY